MDYAPRNTFSKPRVEKRLRRRLRYSCSAAEHYNRLAS